MRVSTAEIDADKMGGRDYAEAGTYLWEVTDLDEEDAKTQQMQVTCEVVSGTTKDQEGKTHREGFFLTGNQARNIQFAVATGFLTEEEAKAAVKAGADLDIDYPQAVGRMFVGKLTPKVSPKDGKTYHNLNFDMWPVDSPKAKGVPMNKKRLSEFLAMPKPTHATIIGGNGNAGVGSGGNGNGGPASDAMGELFD